MKKITTIFATLSLWLQMITAASAFGSYNLLGQGYEHQKITLLALKDFGFDKKSLSELAGSAATLGAVGTPDRPSRGLAYKPYVHCDNGDYLNSELYPQTKQVAQKNLEKCRTHIFSQLKLAVKLTGKLLDIKGDVKASELSNAIACSFNGKAALAKCKIFEALGLAFHTAQDFYAHSNWSDRNNSMPISVDNPQGLKNNSPSKWLNPRIKAPFPNGLISGCYLGIPEHVYCSSKNKKSRIRHYVLNKDHGKINEYTGAIGKGASPRGLIKNNYARAVSVAVEDTKDKWQYFQERVISTYGIKLGQRMLCTLKRDNYKTC